jgi:hypothetical protein
MKRFCRSQLTLLFDGYAAVRLFIVALTISGSLAFSQQSSVISKMAANEEVARAQQMQFSYISEERSVRTGGHLWKEKVVETGDGVLRRLIAIDGHVLSTDERNTEEHRIEDLVAHPDAFRALEKAHREDETHAARLLEMLPTAFQVSQDGQEGGCVRFAFRPSPAFQASTYEERILHVLEGTVSIKEPEDRLCVLEAHVSQPVEFGFGLLGKINSGGHFSLTRAKVDATSWKTAGISIHIDGRILLLKTLSRDQESMRTNIHLVPQHLDLKQAAELSLP